MADFQARALLIDLWMAAEPLPVGSGQQAEVGAPARQPARPRVRRQEGLVEVTAAVFALRQVGADAQPQALAERLLVLAAAPDRQAKAGALLPRFLIAAEGQAPEHRVEIDDLGL